MLVKFIFGVVAFLALWIAFGWTVFRLQQIQDQAVMLGYAENVGGWHWKASIVDFEKGNP
jgi:hypothetical protein